MTTSERTATRERQSYHPERVGRTFDDEMARLGAQVHLSWPVEKRRLSALGIADGQRLLEPGCGPAFFTERLAEWLPGSPIVALDVDERMLAVARQTLCQHAVGHRVTLLRSSAAATGLSSQVFDVAISRYLFQHLPDPVAAASEIRRVLKPGGIHVVIDVDDGLWGLAEPRFVEFEALHRQRARTQRERGGDRFRGRRLGRILHEAGYARVELDVFACHSDEVGLDAFDAQLHPDQFLGLLDERLVSFDEYLRARVLYEQFRHSSGAFVLSVGFIACAENPR